MSTRFEGFDEDADGFVQAHGGFLVASGAFEELAAFWGTVSVDFSVAGSFPGLAFLDVLGFSWSMAKNVGG